MDGKETAVSTSPNLGEGKATKELKVKVGQNEFAIDVAEHHTIHDVRNMVGEEIDDGLLPPNFFFQRNDGIVIGSKQEKTKNAWSFVDKGIAIIRIETGESVVSIKSSPSKQKSSGVAATDIQTNNLSNISQIEDEEGAFSLSPCKADGDEEDDPHKHQRDAYSKSIDVLSGIQSVVQIPLFCSDDRRDEILNEIQTELNKNAPKTVVGVLGSTGAGT